MAKTILLADDSVTIQKVVELTFMDQDYQVVAVSDGQAAIAKLSDLRPDLVIADVHMPEANGYEVCRQAKQTYPGIPVLLLVGTFEPFDQQQADAAGAETHLKKPFDSQDLLRQVDTLISQAAPPPGPAPVAASAPPPAPAAVPPAPAVAPAAAPGLVEPATPVAAPRAPMEDLPVGADTVIPMKPEVPAVPPPAVEPIAAVEVAPVEPPVSLEPEAPFEELIPVEPLPPAEPVDMATETGEPHMPPPAAVFDEPAPEPTFELEPAAPAEAAVVPEPAAEPAPAPAQPAPAPTAEAPRADSNGQELSDVDVDRIARRLIDLMGDSVLRQVAWEVIPDLAEVVIKERIRELESQVE